MATQAKKTAAKKTAVSPEQLREGMAKQSADADALKEQKEAQRIAEQLGAQEVPQGKVNKSTGEVVPFIDYRSIETFDDAVRMVADTFGQDYLATADKELGDGFQVLRDEEKDQLVKQPFFIMSWDFSEGKYRNDEGELTEYVVARLVTRDNRKIIITDGSKMGVRRQLQDYTTATNKQGGLLCRGGLTRSDFTWTDSNGVEQPGTSYFIDTSTQAGS